MPCVRKQSLAVRIQYNHRLNVVIKLSGYDRVMLYSIPIKDKVK